MSDTSLTAVPVWTLTTGDAAPALPEIGANGLTAERFAELRSALALFADAPLVTLEAHSLTPELRRERATSIGPSIPLDSLSPLARELSQLLKRTPSLPAGSALEGGETLYRMQVPAKVAAEFGRGLVKPMASSSAASGIHGDLVASTGKHVVRAKATFVPVQAAPAAASGTAVGTAAGATAAGAVVTVAAPLVLMAVAVGVSAHVDAERQKAIAKMTTLLEQLHHDALNAERGELNGCRDAIDKATALLLDRGRPGASLGLDSAVHAISKATENAERRVDQWESRLRMLREQGAVSPEDLEENFPGVTRDSGEFRAHLEMAALTVALKRRVVVLQAVEAAQADPSNHFENFARSLKSDQERIARLEERVGHVLRGLAALPIRADKPKLGRVSLPLMSPSSVQELLDAVEHVRALPSTHSLQSAAGDVVIEIEQRADGSLEVFPAQLAIA